MEDFFDRVSRVWPAGRSDLHWHVLPAPDEAGVLATPFAGFARPGLAGVPERWMHCTLLHAIGLSADDVDLDALTADVAHHAGQVAPFTLTFDRPAIGSVAVELSGWPGAPFDALVDLVTTATTAHAAPGAFQPGASRYPHMSVAYTTAGADQINPVDLKAQLAHLEKPLTGTVYVDRLHLVAQQHDGAHITWRPIVQIPLGGTP